MSLSETKHALRKYEFPQCAKEALIKIEQILSGRSAPTSKQLDMVMDLISEFIFCESDRRSGRRGSGLNSLQELQLVDVICDYLSSPITETMKNTIFLSLFSGTESQRRTKILNILASMAISASSKPILLAVGVWLQQMGCSSPQSLQLVKNIIRDHFYLNTSNKSALHTLASTVPQFVANFITAITELYIQDKEEKLPPKTLLEVITTWVYCNPTLCMSAQLNPAALPSGAIPMAVLTPLAGLVHWCVLAPLFIDQDEEMLEETSPPKKIKVENGDKALLATQVTKSVTESELYIKLHLGVLASLKLGRGAGGPPTAVNAVQLSAPAHALGIRAQQLAASGENLKTHAQMQECLDRLGQSVQVALANRCVYGNISNLLTALDTLPENRLLRIVVKAQRQSI